MRNLLQPANLITLSRLPLLAVLWAAFARWGNAAIIALLALIIATDVIDGLVARRGGRDSRFGVFLDHGVDKFVMLGVATLLVLYRSLPLWTLWFLLAREVPTVLFSITMMKRIDYYGKSNAAGKAAGVSFALTALVYLLDAAPLRTPALAVSIALATIASAIYLARDLPRLLRGKPLNAEQRSR